MSRRMKSALKLFFDRERFIRSVASTAKLSTPKKLAETSQQDCVNTCGRRGNVMSTITLLNIINLRHSPDQTALSHFTLADEMHCD